MLMVSTVDIWRNIFNFYIMNVVTISNIIFDQHRVKIVIEHIVIYKNMRYILINLLEMFVLFYFCECSNSNNSKDNYKFNVF